MSMEWQSTLEETVTAFENLYTLKDYLQDISKKHTLERWDRLTQTYIPNLGLTVVVTTN